MGRDLLDRDVRFVLLAETHGRQFLPALRRLRRRRVYLGDEETAWVREPTIRQVLEASGLADLELRSIRHLFGDFLADGPGAIFVFPVKVGLPGEQHRGYGRDPEYARYMATPLDELPNRLVVLSETSLHRLLPEPGSAAEGEAPRWQIPHVHRILCRTEVEARHCRGAYRGEVPVSLVGDLFLDEVAWPRRYRREGEAVALLTSTHRIDATPLLARMLGDLERLLATGRRIERVYLKEHPGTEDTAYHEPLRRRVETWGATLEVVPRHHDLALLARQVALATIQDSLSSHLALRRLGVESFLYLSGGGLGVDREFLAKAGHPEATLGARLDGTYAADRYDAWLASTYRLDGRVVERFFAALPAAASSR